MKWSATEGSLPTISSAGQIAVARVAGAIEQELDLVSERPLPRAAAARPLSSGPSQYTVPSGRHRVRDRVAGR